MGMLSPLPSQLVLRRAEVSTYGPSTRCSLNEALTGGPSRGTEHQEWSCVRAPLPCFEGTLGPCPGDRPPGGQTARTVGATGLEHATSGTPVTDPSVGILNGPSPHTDQNLLYQESTPQRHLWLRKKRQTGTLCLQRERKNDK